MPGATIHRRQILRLLAATAVSLGAPLAGCTYYDDDYWDRRGWYYGSRSPWYAYDYSPDSNVYFDLHSGYYHYRCGKVWCRARKLPRHYYLRRDRRRRLHIRDKEPWRRNHEHCRDHGWWEYGRHRKPSHRKPDRRDGRRRDDDRRRRDRDGYRADERRDEDGRRRAAPRVEPKAEPRVEPRAEPRPERKTVPRRKRQAERTRKPEPAPRSASPERARPARRPRAEAKTDRRRRWDREERRAIEDESQDRRSRDRRDWRSRR